MLWEILKNAQSGTTQKLWALYFVAKLCILALLLLGQEGTTGRKNTGSKICIIGVVEVQYIKCWKTVVQFSYNFLHESPRRRFVSHVIVSAGIFNIFVFLLKQFPSFTALVRQVKHLKRSFTSVRVTRLICVGEYILSKVLKLDEVFGRAL